MTAPQMPGPDATVPEPGAVTEKPGTGEAGLAQTSGGTSIASVPVGASTTAPADYPTIRPHRLGIGFH